MIGGKGATQKSGQWPHAVKTQGCEAVREAVPALTVAGPKASMAAE